MEHELTARQLADELRQAELRIAALEAGRAEQALPAVVEAMHDGFSRLDAAGVHVDVNPALCAMTGFTREELVGAGAPHPYWPPEESEHISAALAQVIGGQPRTFELTFMRKSGERFPVLVTPSVLRDSTGDIVSAFAVIKDISELAGVRDRLAQSEELFRLTFDQSPIGAALVRDQRFQRVNDAMCAMLGYTRDELLGLSVLEITHPEDADVSTDTVHRLASGENDSISLEKRYLRKDGVTVWARTVARAVRDAGGQVIAQLTMIDDVTDRRRILEELRESEQRLRTVLDAAHEGIILQARDGAVLTFNRAAGRVFGLEESEVVGRSALGRDWQTFREDGSPWPPQEHPTVLAMESGRPSLDQQMGVVRDGTTRWLVANAYPIIPEGATEAVAAVVSFSDQTDRLAAERSLAEAQRLLDATQAISRLGGWEYDVAAGRFTWTRELYRLHGVGLDFDVNDLRRNISFYAPEDQAAVEAAFAGILETGAGYDLELRFQPVGADRPIWVRATARAELPDGTVVRVIGNLEDIDERKRATMALAAERERAQTYLDIAGVMIVAIGSDGVVTVANRKACQVLGRDEAGVVGQDWFRLAIPGEVSAAVREVFDGLMSGEAEPWDLYENEVVTATGERRLIAWHNVLLRDADGAIAGTLSSGEDITERRRDEEALRETEERYRSLFEQSPVSVWEEDFSAVREWFDAQGPVDDWGAYFAARPEHAPHCAGLVRLLASNKTGLDFFGAASVEEPAVGLPRYFTEESYPAFRDELAALAGGGTQFAAEIPIADHEGTRRVLDVRVNVVPGHEARLDRVLVSFVDVTEQRAAEAEIRRLNEELQRRVASRTEQLDAATRELEALAYSIAHDVRAPLRTIDGFSAAVMEDEGGALSDEAVASLRRVRAAAQTLARLLDDLTGLSRASRRELVRQTMDLSALAEEVGREVALEYKDRSVELTVAPGLSAEADPMLARIILRELLGNAWKFTAVRAEAHVEVGALAADTDGDERVFFVRDDGAGFDMRFAEQLFGVFQRMHPPGEFPGDGVGLAMVQRLVRRHGGRCWAEAEPEQGATFFFTLPPGG